MGDSDLPERKHEQALAVQPDFFDDGSFGLELANLDKAQTRHGKYTGEQLARNIELRDRVIALHVQGIGVRRMVFQLRAAGFHIGENSVLALLRSSPDLVATEKKRLSGTLGGIITLMTDSIRERLIDGTMKPSPIDVAIMIDKKAVVDGEAGLIVEHRFNLDASADAFTKRLEEMKRAKVAKAGDSNALVIDLNPQ